MNHVRVALCSVLLATCATTSSVLPSSFPPIADPDPVGAEQIQAVRGSYDSLIAPDQVTNLEDLPAHTKRLIDAVPEGKRTAAHNLYVGNLLFQLDPVASRELHLRALRQEPGSLSATLEAALELLRSGETREGCVLLERYLGARVDHAVMWALAAYCRLEQGHDSAAFEAWSRANPRGQREEIEGLLSEIFGFQNPWAIRARLLKAFATPPNPTAVAELIRNDLWWEIDWWNSQPQVELAKKDLARFSGTLSAFEVESLKLLIDLGASVPEPTAEQRDALRDRIRLHAAALPTPVIRGYLDFAQRGSIFTREEAAEWLGATLEARGRSTTATADDLELLAAIVVDDPKRLEQADRQCWERFKDARCGGSLYVGLQKRGDLKLTDADFVDALQRLPAEPLVHLAAFQLTPPGSPERTMRIRKLAIAEFHRLRLGNPVHGEHNLTGLMGIFAELEKSLEVTSTPP